MNYEQYAPLAIRTAKFINREMDIAHACMGIITEVGEIVDCFKRNIIYGKPLDLVNLEEEIGDTFWYLNLYWHTLGMKAADNYSGEELAHIDKVATKVLPMAEFPLHQLALAYTAGGVALDSSKTFLLQGQLEQLAATHWIDIGKCLDKNIAKLAARYGDKYSDYMALNRNTDNEAKAML